MVGSDNKGLYFSKCILPNLEGGMNVYQQYGEHDVKIKIEEFKDSRPFAQDWWRSVGELAPIGYAPVVNPETN